MDMKTLAAWTSTDPKTCFDTSKSQILTGRCGRSLHRLYTSDSRASPPSASCTRSAKEPSRRHSPEFSGSSVGAPVAVGRGVAVAVEATAAARSRASWAVGVAAAAMSRAAFRTAGWRGEDMRGRQARGSGGRGAAGWFVGARFRVERTLARALSPGSRGSRGMGCLVTMESSLEGQVVRSRAGDEWMRSRASELGGRAKTYIR